MVRLSLSALKEAGSKFELLQAQFEKMLEMAVADCLDRDREAKPRQVIMAWEIRPADAQTSPCQEVCIQTTCDIKLPKTHPTGRVFAVPHAGDGSLWVRSGSPEEPAQTTFEDPGPIEGE